MNKSNRESSKKQRQLIGMACAYFGMGKVDKQVMLRERFGVSSATELNYAQAEELIDSMVARGYTIKSKKRPYLTRKQPVRGGKQRRNKNITAMASQAELSKIDALARLISWRTKNGMERWMKKRFDLEKIRTGHDAFRVIEGLKGMFENQMKKRFGPDWWKQPNHDVEVCYYIIQHFPCMVAGFSIPAYDRIRELENSGSLPRAAAG